MHYTTAVSLEMSDEPNKILFASFQKKKESNGFFSNGKTERMYQTVFLSSVRIKISNSIFFLINSVVCVINTDNCVINTGDYTINTVDLIISGVLIIFASDNTNV